MTSNGMCTLAATRAGNPKLHEKLSEAGRWGEGGRRQKEEGEWKERRQGTGQGRRGRGEGASFPGLNTWLGGLWVGADKCPIVCSPIEFLANIPN